MNIRGNNPEKPLVIAVGGGGCHLDTGSVAFRMVRSQLEDADIPYLPIHGCTDLAQPDPRVYPPSEQRDMITQAIDTLPEQQPVLLVSQCIGSIATINYLRDNIDNKRPTAGVILSPATRPDIVVSRPESRARRHQNDTIMRLKVLAGNTRDFDISIAQTVDAQLPSAYLDETLGSPDLIDSMTELHELGKLALIAGERDWNTPAIADISQLQQSTAAHPQNLHLLPRTGHSLHLSAARDVTAQTRQEFQQRNIRTTLRTGMALLQS